MKLLLQQQLLYGKPQRQRHSGRKSREEPLVSCKVYTYTVVPGCGGHTAWDMDGGGSLVRRGKRRDSPNLNTICRKVTCSTPSQYLWPSPNWWSANFTPRRLATIARQVDTRESGKKGSSGNGVRRRNQCCCFRKRFFCSTSSQTLSGSPSWVWDGTDRQEKDYRSATLESLLVYTEGLNSPI